MKFRVYVGNLPYTSNDQDIQVFFASHPITSAKIVLDKETSKPRGFGFAAFPDASSMQTAIEALNGTLLGGRKIVVSVAHDRASVPQGRASTVREGNIGPATRTSTASIKSDNLAIARAESIAHAKYWNEDGEPEIA